MHKSIVIICFMVYTLISSAQEFNAVVQINAESTGRVDLPIFKTLERSLSEFINKNKWTNQKYKVAERINCSFFINVIGYDNDRFQATLQVLASRPIFGSSYSTTIFNFNDKDVNFNYLEYQPLNYNPSSFDSNLVSVVAFYLYTILGVDSDTFSLNGGTNYYEDAKSIVNVSQSSNEIGWAAKGSDLTRYKLNDDLLSGTYEGYRTAMYQYHRDALDMMHDDPKKGKEAIIKSLVPLKQMNATRPNSTMMRVFFDAKAEEITKILSGGTSVNIAETVTLLNRIAPTYSKNWKEIKF